SQHQRKFVGPEEEGFGALAVSESGGGSVFGFAEAGEGELVEATLLPYRLRVAVVDGRKTRVGENVIERGFVHGLVLGVAAEINAGGCGGFDGRANRAECVEMV